jgi:hypothetical protein
MNPGRKQGWSLLSNKAKISLFLAILFLLPLVGFQAEAADKENCLM